MRALSIIVAAVALPALSACQQSPDVTVTLNKNQNNYIFSGDGRSGDGGAADGTSTAAAPGDRVGDLTGDHSQITITYTTESEQGINQEAVQRFAAEVAAALSGQGKAEATGGTADSSGEGGTSEPAPEPEPTQESDDTE